MLAFAQPASVGHRFAVVWLSAEMPPEDNDEPRLAEILAHLSCEPEECNEHDCSCNECGHYSPRRRLSHATSSAGSYKCSRPRAPIGAGKSSCRCRPMRIDDR